ncbi:MAG: adenosylcobinamide-phosphate synthase CbiB [Vulcanimicrobiaceae bacterium]
MLVGGALVDAVAGDPAWLPHPVRGFGFAAAAGERAVRPWTHGDARRESIAGGALTVAIVGGAYALARVTLAATDRVDRRAGFVLAIVLAWTTIAARDLARESADVLAALELGDLARARTRLARIVGRDTAALDATEIARATIETLAESACDGIVAPLCALALGGVPLALAFKAASTLDSTIGHIEAPYTYFGRVAARLDDACCFVPARVTALAICASASGVAQGSVGAAWRTWQRDGRAHASPNAGQSEAAIAGALRVRLGGHNVYDGVAKPAPSLGAEFRPPDASDIRRARRAVALVSLTCTLGLASLRALATRAWRQRTRWRDDDDAR